MGYNTSRILSHSSLLWLLRHSTDPDDNRESSRKSGIATTLLALVLSLVYITAKFCSVTICFRTTFKQDQLTLHFNVLFYARAFVWIGRDVENIGIGYSAVYPYSQVCSPFPVSILPPSSRIGIRLLHILTVFAKIESFILTLPVFGICWSNNPSDFALQTYFDAKVQVWKLRYRRPPARLWRKWWKRQLDLDRLGTVSICMGELFWELLLGQRR